MTARLRAQDLVELALSRAGTMVHSVVNALQDELESSAHYVPLRDKWRRARASFAPAFEAHLAATLHSAVEGGDPMRREFATLDSLDSLSLVDEQQALQDVAVAHIVHTAEDLSRSEMHQVGNYFAALRGTARARERDNPLRPALYAHALYLALAECGLNGQPMHDLLQLMASPMATALQDLYLAICAKLRAAQLSDMVAGHAGPGHDSLDHRRMAAAHGVNSGHGTLAGLAHHVNALNSRPQALHSAHGALGQEPPPFVRATGPDVLTRLYDQILADPRLLPPLKGALARMQVAVVRLARVDSSLLRRQEHPAWALLNRVAAHGMTFDRADDPVLQAFLHFVDTEVRQLVDAPALTAPMFHQVLQRVQAEIDRQTQVAHSPSAEAIAALQRSEQRSEWLGLIREQIEHQIIGAPLLPRVRHFLQTAWVDLIVESMVRHGTESPEALADIDTVDALLDSLRAPADREGLDGIRLRLPVLIQRLQDGCDRLALPEGRRAPFFADLMEQHSRVLRGMPALERTAPRPVVPPPPPPTADQIVKRLMDERDSQPPSHWLESEVDRAGLPTVPVSLYASEDKEAARAALQAWIAELQVGDWYHLFIQGDWQTAQIAWISPSHQTLLFVGRAAHQRHSLTRGALEALLANGLITALEDDVVQRAVDTLMSGLDGV